MHAPITLQRIALETDVSISTVSRALTHPDRVAFATRERIRVAALRLGYAPNQLARSLRHGDSKTIGLILSDIMVRFHSEVAKGVEEIAQSHGYLTILCNSNEDGNREAQYLELLSGFRMGGLILEPTELNVTAVEALARNGLRVVEVDRISGASGVTAVLSDNVGGAGDAARHFLELGHREFGLVIGNLAFTSARERRDGFLQALQQAGIALEPQRVQNCVNNASGGYRATLELLRARPQVTALFIGNAQVMNGALKAVRELGLRVPQDVSLLSFDDTDWAAFTDPALTVVTQAAYELGRAAAKLIFNKRKRSPENIVRLPTQLIVRQSTGAARKP